MCEIMSPFLRIGFSSFEMDPGLAYHEEVLNPYCAVYMKEAVETGRNVCVRVCTHTQPFVTKKGEKKDLKKYCVF